MDVINTLGRRKSSVARVYLSKGKGKITINKRDYKAWAKGLKKAGYATDPQYPDKLINLIERYRLDRYDLKKRKTKEETESITTISDHKIHQVQKGDTLYSISKKYKVELQLLVQENKIENNTIFLGQNLIIP